MRRKQPVGEYLREVWKMREFVVETSKAELHSRNMDTALGNAWYLLNPLAQIGVYFLVFGQLLDVTRGLENFLGFLALGVFLFRFSQQATMAGVKSLTGNRALIRSLRFPRAVLPLSAVVGEVIALAPAVAMALLIAVLSGEKVTVEWLLLVPYVGLLVLFTIGIAFAAARVNGRFRDTQQVVPILFRLLFYLSGILYSVERFTQGSEVKDWIVSLSRFFPVNPFYSLTRLAKSAVLEEVSAPPEILLSAVIWALVVFVGGFLFFKAGELNYGRD